MTKTLLISFLLFLAVGVNAQSLQDPTLQGLHKFSDEYFRSDPFKGEFSAFLKHLINDPTISDRRIQMRTDTSLYVFYGVYKNYNPFFFKPKRVEILLEESSISYSDSSRQADTIFTYQLIAYADDNPKNELDVQKEFDKIHRQTKRKFFDTSFKEVKDGEMVTTAWHNYFVPYYGVAPASVIWSKLKDQHELVINITLRFKMVENMAVLPMPLYGSK